MKFCVFGFKKEYPKEAKAKNNLVVDPNSFASALTAFKNATESGEYKEVYFLVDFGYAEAPFWRAIDVYYFNGTIIPWILISKWKNGEESNQMISKIRLKLKGFSEEYKNCTLAMEKFCYYIDSKIKCELYVDIFDKTNKFITSSQIIIDKNKCNTNFYCKKFRI